MKRLYILLILVLFSLTTYSQQSPQQFFSKLFRSFKAKDANDFAANFATNDQFRLLAFAYMHVEKITQDSLDKAEELPDSAFRARIKSVFSMILKKADSLHADIPNSEYIDCKFTETKDTGMLCVSLTGTLYFKSDSKFYQIKVNEAVLIKDEWRIIEPGELSILTDIGFLSREPDKVSAFGTFTKSKIKVKAVVLQPPPPISKQVPPPPPGPTRKKKSNN
jgi:hypothetical protein